MKYLLTALAIVLAFATGVRFATLRSDLAARKAAIAEDRTQLDAAFDARAGVVSDLASEAPERMNAVKNQVAAACSALAGAGSPEAKTAANDKLSAAFLLLETAPGFADAQDDLTAADDHIAEAREKYNGDLEHYNAILQTFPVNLVAAISGYSRSNSYFKTRPAETTRR